MYVSTLLRAQEDREDAYHADFARHYGDVSFGTLAEMVKALLTKAQEIDQKRAHLANRYKVNGWRVPSPEPEQLLAGELLERLGWPQEPEVFSDLAQRMCDD